MIQRIEEEPEFEPRPEMTYRSIGESGIRVSVIGYGTWSIGGIKWGPTDDDLSMKALHRALDHGINLFDTSSMYGRGRSERLLGNVARERREEMVIATKGGVRIRSDGSLYCDTRPETLQEDLDRSRERLDTDTIDLYQIQWPPEDGLSASTLQKVEDLLDRGTIRAFGVCHFPAPALERIRRHLPLATVQLRVNLLEPERFEREHKYCIEHNIDVLSCTPLAKGILTGKHHTRPDLDPIDNRSGDPLFDPDRFSDDRETVEDVVEVAGDLDKPASAVALNWTHQQEGITAALAGMKTVDQVDQNVYAAGWSFSEAVDDEWGTGKTDAKEDDP